MRRNTADNNDARVDVGNDRRLDPYSHHEHDKACVLQSTVEHIVASEHFNSSLAHITSRPTGTDASRTHVATIFERQ